MKTITVSGALIIRTNPETNRKELFATARGYGDWKGWWEFPGGKLEPGETPEQCIIREIREELATDITAGPVLDVIEYDYPEFHLIMHCIICSIVSGNLTLLEAQEARWLNADTVRTVKWLPADLQILDKVEALLRT